MTLFETRRLASRKAAMADADFLLALWTKPRVMANVGFPQGLPVTREEIEAKIVDQAGSTEFDCWLVAQLRESGQVIGECKLGSPNEEGISSTDVKLLPRFWGHKYGLEIKQGLLDYLFAHTDCLAVEATPNVNNSPSIKMQEAVGGVLIGQEVHHFPESMRDYTSDVHYYIYRVYRAE